MPALRHVLAVSAVAWLLAGAGGPHGPVEIDLTSLGTGLVNGRRAALPVVGSGHPRRFVQGPQGTLDVFFRVPEQGELLFALAADVPRDAFSVSVESGNGLEAVPVQKGTGDGWRVSLERFAGDPIRLRFENRGEKPLAWIRPRVLGREALRPPLLDHAPMRPVNVLLYVVDTLRADRLSVYGYERPTSPNLEELAKRGTVFLNAYAQAPVTVPSVTSLFASRLPSELNGRLAPRGPARKTLAEAFRAAGYDTAAFQANILLRRGRGYDRGFDDYRVLRGKAQDGTRRTATAAELNARVLPWPRAHRERPFFLYVQSMDVHFPYSAPSPYGEMFLSAASVKRPRRLQGLEAYDPNVYDGCIAYADSEIGKLVTELGRLGLDERTAIVITSDHGEPLGQHGELMHGRSLYEEVARVPLIMVLPWEAGGERVDDVVRLLDLAPTLLDLAGVPPPGHFLGGSLLHRAHRPGPATALGEAVQLRSQAVYQWYVREGPWKLIMTQDSSRLFHLPSDPAEKNDVSASHPVEVGYLETLVMRGSPALRPNAEPPVPLKHGLSKRQGDELEESLRALGYVE